MDDSAPRPMVDGRIPEQTRAGQGEQPGLSGPVAPGVEPRVVPGIVSGVVPGVVPGSYQWGPVGLPGPRMPLPHAPVPYRHPGDPYGVWPNSVADPRRDRHTVAIVVCSILAALATVIAVVPQLPDRHTGARAAADAGTVSTETAPSDEDDDDPGPGDKDSDGADGDGAPPKSETVDTPELTGPGASSAARATVLTRTQSIAGARTTALRNNDANAFVAAVDKNNKTLADTERRLFANLRKVPFDQSDWNTRTVSDARTDPGASGGWPVTATVEVAFQHKIANADVRAVAERYIWTVHCLNAADTCSLTAVTGARDSTVLGPSGYPAPWDVWDLAVERRPHVVAMGPVATAPDLRVRADEAEAAAVYDLGMWKGPSGTSPGFVLTLTRERTTFEKLYSRESPGDWAAGFALPLTASGDKDLVGGSRVVIDLDEMDQDPAFAKIILRHELVHALLDPITRAEFDRIPLWTAEGFADWIAQADRSIRGTYEARAVSTQIKDGTFKGTLPSDDDFASEDEDVIDAAYNQAHLVIRYLADTYGPDKACAFVADVYQGRATGVDAAIRSATGKSLSDFEKGWADWTRTNFG